MILQTLFLYLPVCCVTNQNGFWYKTTLVSFQLCECTLCGRLPVLACSATCWDEIWNLEPFLRVNRLLLRRPRFQTKPSRALFHLKAARVHPDLAVHAPRRISIRLSANKNLLLHQLAGNIKLHGKRFHISLSLERPLKQFPPKQNHPLCRLICAFCEFSCLGWTCSSEPTPVTGEFFLCFYQNYRNMTREQNQLDNHEGGLTSWRETPLFELTGVYMSHSRRRGWDWVVWVSQPQLLSSWVTQSITVQRHSREGKVEFKRDTRAAAWVLCTIWKYQRRNLNLSLEFLSKIIYVNGE